jgi:hypothetical protein
MTIAWTHDDNMQSQLLGWIIAPVDPSNVSNLISLRKETPSFIFENEIRKNLLVSSLHSKAFVFLSNHSIKHFKFQSENEKRGE